MYLYRVLRISYVLCTGIELEQQTLTNNLDKKHRYEDHRSLDNERYQESNWAYDHPSVPSVPSVPTGKYRHPAHHITGDTWYIHWSTKYSVIRTHGILGLMNKSHDYQGTEYANARIAMPCYAMDRQNNSFWIWLKIYVGCVMLFLHACALSSYWILFFS